MGMTLDMCSNDRRFDVRIRLVQIADNINIPLVIRLVAEGVLMLKDIKEGIDKLNSNPERI